MNRFFKYILFFMYIDFTCLKDLVVCSDESLPQIACKVNQ